MPHEVVSTRRVAVVIPARNEEGNVGMLVERLSACVGDGLRLVLVDDGSTDGTWAAMLGVVGVMPGVTCVRMAPAGVGKERAVRRGLSHALGLGCDLIAVMDADLQDPPELLSELCDEMAAHSCSQVVAVRRQRVGEGVVRRGGAGLYYALMRDAVGAGWNGMRDMRVMRPEVVEAFLREPVGASCVKFDTLRTFGDARCVRYDFEPRASGRSSWNLAGLARLACEGIVVSSGWLEFVPVVTCGATVVLCVVAMVLWLGFGARWACPFAAALLVSVPVQVGLSVCTLMLHVVLESVRGVEAYEVDVVCS